MQFISVYGRKEYISMIWDAFHFHASVMAVKWEISQQDIPSVWEEKSKVSFISMNLADDYDLQIAGVRCVYFFLKF
jgi:hypothetical protein